jgi:hypothetical protein
MDVDRTPRPSPSTDAEPSSYRITDTLLANPARPSSADVDHLHQRVVGIDGVGVHPGRCTGERSRSDVFGGISTGFSGIATSFEFAYAV